MLIDFVISSWIYLGIFNLVILWYQDYKNNMMVDDRLNSFMLGISTILFLYILKDKPILEIFKLIVFSGVLFFILEIIYRKISLGKGDINTLRWINLGLFSINNLFVIQFTILLLVFSFIHRITIKIMEKILKRKINKVQYYPVLTLAFSLYILFITGF